MENTEKNQVHFREGEDGVLIVVDSIGEHQLITLDMIKQIWSYMQNRTIEDIEYINAEINGNLLVCVITVANGQGGVVFIWDVNNKKFTHYSDGRYALKAVLHKEKVFVLRRVSYWGVKAHLELDMCAYGTKDLDNNDISIPIDECIQNEVNLNTKDYIISFDKDDIPRLSIAKN